MYDPGFSIEVEEKTFEKMKEMEQQWWDEIAKLKKEKKEHLNAITNEWLEKEGNKTDEQIKQKRNEIRKNHPGQVEYKAKIGQIRLCISALINGFRLDWS